MIIQELKRGESKEIAKGMCKNGSKKTTCADIDVGD